MRKISFITLTIFILFFLIPNGYCTSMVYLNPGEYIEQNIYVTAGDRIKGNYRTYDSSFQIRVGWCYMGCNYFSPPYPSGNFQFVITSGYGTLEIYIMNIDTYGGYLEFSIGRQGDDGDSSYVMLIIMGVLIVGAVFISIGIGIHFYSKYKNRRIINDNDLQES